MPRYRRLIPSSEKLFYSISKSIIYGFLLKPSKLYLKRFGKAFRKIVMRKYSIFQIYKFSITLVMVTFKLSVVCYSYIILLFLFINSLNLKLNYLIIIVLSLPKKRNEKKIIIDVI